MQILHRKPETDGGGGAAPGPEPAGSYPPPASEPTYSYDSAPPANPPLADAKTTGQTVPAPPPVEYDKVNAVSVPQIIGLIILILVVVFAIMNTEVVPLSLFFWSLHAPLIVLIMAAFVVGYISAMLMGWRRRRKKRKR
ncbi:MAG: LapA family protein [Oscillospiraceae bacterium]|nr:LapA family protein [Oscillospiraceae bacterium]MDD4368546.1 LapA family protein [Oscillospiraceae bacterium]